MDSELQNYRNMLLKRKQMADIYKAELKKTYDKSSIVTSDTFDNKKPKLLVEDENENPKFREFINTYGDKPTQLEGELDEYYYDRLAEWETNKNNFDKLIYNDEKNKLLNSLRKIMSNNDATYILNKLDTTPDNLLLLNKYWGKFEKKLRDSFTSLDKNTLLGFIDSFLENIDNELSGKTFKMIEGISDKLDTLQRGNEEKLNNLTNQIGLLKDIADKNDKLDIGNKLEDLLFNIDETKDAIKSIKTDINLSLEQKAEAQSKLMKQLNGEIIKRISEVKDANVKNTREIINNIITSEGQIKQSLSKVKEDLKKEIKNINTNLTKTEDNLKELIKSSSGELKKEIVDVYNLFVDIEDNIKNLEIDKNKIEDVLSNIKEVFDLMTEVAISNSNLTAKQSKYIKNTTEELSNIARQLLAIRTEVTFKDVETADYEKAYLETLSTDNLENNIDAIVERGKDQIADLQSVEPEEEPTSSRKQNEGNIEDLLKLDIDKAIGKISRDGALLIEMNKTIKKNILEVRNIADQYMTNLEGLNKEGFNQKITQLLNRLNRANAKPMNTEELELILELIKYYRKVKADEGILEKYRTYKKITKTEKNMFNEETSKPVFGFGSKRVYGKGLSIDEKSTYPKENEFYRLFGRYLVDMDKLNNNVLKVYHHTSFNNVKYIKNSTISDEFVNLIMFILDKKKFNDKLFNSLEAEEQELFKILFTKSGLSKMMNVKDIDNTTKQAKQDYKNMIERYNILQGEINGGNNNPKVYNELNTLVSDLKKQITYLVKLNSMPKGEAQLKILSL